MTPAVVTAPSPLREAVAAARREGKTVGLVPTMGALHAGHAALLAAARAADGFVVASIFVNPTQFGLQEDLARYPRSLDADLDLCGRKGVDLVFAPTAEVMYPPGFRTFVEVTGLSDVLEGASRPGHFRGVVTVVLKLFNLVQPDRAYFGQKDAQQVRIIQQVVRDLDLPVKIVVRPTVREPDGLALSSRTRYLDADQRRNAAVLHQALVEAEAAIRAGERDVAAVQRMMADRIAATPGAVLDYAAVVDADTLTPVHQATGDLLLALAVRFGNTRLIDNRSVRSPQ
jgi:pantoate--beta-alanine ligase